MISGTEHEKVEMTDKMIERADELDNAVYDMLLTALQLDSAEAEKEFPWNIAIVREVLGFVCSVLAREGKAVCNPYISNGSYRCTLSECGCRKCSCQTKFMERERIMGRISEAMQLNDIEVKDNDGNRLHVREPLTGEEFEIAIKEIFEETNNSGSFGNADLFSDIEEALSHKGFKVLDGSYNDVIVRNVETGQDYQIRIEKIPG